MKNTNPKHLSCLSCNLCCYTRAGVGREDFVPSKFIEIDEKGYAWMRKKEGGSCSALEGNLCLIYDRRPETCRLFEPGGVACDFLKETK